MQRLASYWCGKVILSLFLVISLFSAHNAFGQRVVIKTNALEYCALTPNIALEARLSPKFSLQMGASAYPITTPINGYVFSNYRIEPELRYWFNRPMARHFMALSSTVGAYSFKLKERNLKGDVIALGLSYGYDLVLSRHWNLEFEVGAGLASINGTDFTGTEAWDMPMEHKYRFVPMRLAVSFGYVFD